MVCAAVYISEGMCRGVHIPRLIGDKIPYWHRSFFFWSPNRHKCGNTIPQRKFLVCPLVSCIALVFEPRALPHTRPCLNTICQPEMFLPVFIILKRLKVTDIRIDFLFLFHPIFSVFHFILDPSKKKINHSHILTIIIYDLYELEGRWTARANSKPVKRT
jgi:hypothetical protein